MKVTKKIRTQYDVVVVGARIAGASTAMLLARNGLSVLLIDRGFRGKDTLSTHALMRPGILQLQRWGLLDELRKTDTPPVRKTTFHYGNETLPIDIKSKDGVDALYAPRRFVIDTLVADAAEKAGADLLYKTTLSKVETDESGRVIGVIVLDEDGNKVRVLCDHLIGADGLHSAVARDVNAETLHRCEHFTSSIYGYFDCDENNGYHWYFDQSAASGLIPTNGGQACIFASFSSSLAPSVRAIGKDIVFERILENSASPLAELVRKNPLKAQLMMFYGNPGFIRKSAGPGWSLVGDAACFKDPITAHGMTDALRDAEFLARSICYGKASVANQTGVVESLQKEFVRTSEAIASFEWELPSLKEQHISLSRLMSSEYEQLLHLDSIACV